MILKVNNKNTASFLEDEKIYNKLDPEAKKEVDLMLSKGRSLPYALANRVQKEK